MPFTIIGSGFGLYGYLPALVRHRREAVTLPASYREKVLNRPELADCLSSITWATDREQALDQVDSVVVCVPPRAQGEMIAGLSRRRGLGTVVLEKPVAETPAKSATALDELYNSGKNVVVNYSFLHTPWFDRFSTLAGSAQVERIEINWSFKAHHITNELSNWKRFPDEGGGVIRFFGIHLIAVLAHAGYSHVVETRVERSGSEPAARWSARFTGPHRPEAAVTIDTNSEKRRFSVHGSAGTPGIELDDPFDGGAAPMYPGEDRRVPIIAEMLRASGQGAASRAGYARVNALWHTVEECTRSL